MLPAGEQRRAAPRGAVSGLACFAGLRGTKTTKNLQRVRQLICNQRLRELGEPTKNQR
jgi:hypothetical protein